MPARIPLVRKRVGRFGRPVAQRSPRTKSGGGTSARVCLMPRATVSSRALARSPRLRWAIASSQRTRPRRPWPS
eukprot:8175923-Alexandrium_andersonii.AAC.1